MKNFVPTKGKADSIAPTILFFLAAVLVILGLVIFALWSLANGWTRQGVNWWAVVATLLIVPAFFFGFYLGKVEARGLLSGFDKSLDKMASVIGQVATMRDQSRITVHHATQTQTPYTVVLPNQPTITHRRLSSGDDENELDL